MSKGRKKGGRGRGRAGSVPEAGLRSVLSSERKAGTGAGGRWVGPSGNVQLEGFSALPGRGE